MNNYVEYAIGVGFFVENTMRRIGSDVWYIVAKSAEEAETIFFKYADKWIADHPGTEFVHEMLSARVVDQATWEPYGKEVML